MYILTRAEGRRVEVSAPVLIFIFSCCDVMRMRHGMPEIKMKENLIISYILVEAPLAIF